ncbi:MAG: isoprenylcysteine carboxylmethyltransferase family protein [Gemmatimonadaceae bacterium]
MAQDAPLRSAGVHFPPPFIYLIGFLTGWLLDRVWPAPLPQVAPPLRYVIIALFLIVWLVLMLGAFAKFMLARTAIIPNRAASMVVTSGPYRFTRNPMYVGLAALYLAIALFYGSWWLIVWLFPVLLVVRYAVIAREERYLTSAFPDEYPAYCSRVRRWL